MGIAIEVLPLGPVAVAARAWQRRGERLVTAIVKATCSIQHDAPMVAVPPVPIATEERHYRNNPVASLMRASDLALVVPRPEIVIVGSAFAGPGQKVQSTTVRVAVAQGATMLVNKRLDIVGDRRARPGETPPDPMPFERMPILYEHAYGGIASRDNPVGVGMATEGDGKLTLPNVLLAPQGGHHPAGLGPIPSAWPIRQRKRGSLGWAAANVSAYTEVPDDFDDAYFQTAPVDQQMTELVGGELVAIVNMHPEHGTLRAFLPKVRGVALGQTAKGDRISFRLRIDTVHVEPDAMRAEIVYRGAAVIAEGQLDDLRLAGALEQPDEPLSFPDLSTMSGLVVRPGDRRESAADLASTAVIGDASAGPAPQGPARGLGGTVVIGPEPTANRTTVVIEPDLPPTTLPFARGSEKTDQLQAPADPALALEETDDARDAEAVEGAAPPTPDADTKPGASRTGVVKDLYKRFKP